MASGGRYVQVPSGGGGGNEGRYFTEVKKSEMNTLKTSLSTATNERDSEKIKEVLQRIIYYMTIGMDVSPLFPDVTMVAATTDIVIKKMVYLYIVHYSKSNSDLLLLVINILIKDCSDRNPVVRGLAIRSLCSFNSEDIVQYAYKYVMYGLRDFSGYVRKISVLSLAKLYRLSMSSINMDEVLPILYGMSMDQDPQVIVNSIVTLNELRPGWEITPTMVQFLLGKLKEFNEWSQCIVIDTLYKYTPKDEDEVLDILNLLDDKLKQSNSALVLGIVKLFIKITEGYPVLEDIHNEVYERVKDPLITLVESSESNETAYTILCHIYLLMSRSPHLFEREYRHFYCKYNDPIYIKSLKIKILSDIASNHTNALHFACIKEIVQELAEYIYEGNLSIMKQSIQVISMIGQKNSQVVNNNSSSSTGKTEGDDKQQQQQQQQQEEYSSIDQFVLDMFISFLQTEHENIISNTLIALKDFLRVFPAHAKKIIGYLGLNKLVELQVDQAIEAILWIYGEHPNVDQETPYIVEGFMKRFKEQSTSVKIQLLISAIKIYFERPGEMLPILQHVLLECSDLSQDPDLHETYLFYARLLSIDLNVANKIINAGKKDQKMSLTSFLEDEFYEYKDKIFEEFNTLSVVYGKHSSTFMNQPIADPDIIPASISAGGSKSTSSEVTKQIEGSPHNLLDTFALDNSYQLTPQEFQSQWISLEEGHRIEIQLNKLLGNTEIEEVLAKDHITCLAFGSVNQQTKLYYHAKQKEVDSATPPPLFLIEMIIDEVSLMLTISFKSSDEKKLHLKFIPKFLLSLSNLIPSLFK
ncbi:hypothetical protein CYY_000853 [Polysphondylium violaceum]|uniref:AP complex subunit beta n=1 Tax=Polysphondylium violaceum TaxID=133409 RepID=A0A8J4PZ06_9MYCE|nr:hypothetical protein CYY_000853 [Polysphondylium violaceum]